MIADNLSRSDRYAFLSARFAAGFDFLKRNPAALADGRYDIDGDHCFALVQSYTTKPPAQAAFEAHQNYADIQFIIAGEETLLWAPREKLGPVTKPYVPEKDIAFFAPPAQSTPLNLCAGELAIFFPEDGHAPCLQTAGPCAIRKVVIKVRV